MKGRRVSSRSRGCREWARCGRRGRRSRTAYPGERAPDRKSPPARVSTVRRGQASSENTGAHLMMLGTSALSVGSARVRSAIRERPRVARKWPFFRAWCDQRDALQPLVGAPECRQPVRLRRCGSAPGGAPRFRHCRSMNASSRSHRRGPPRARRDHPWGVRRASLPIARPGWPRLASGHKGLPRDAVMPLGMCRLMRVRRIASSPAKPAMASSRSLDCVIERRLPPGGALMGCLRLSPRRTPNRRGSGASWRNFSGARA